jgi:hypothetical protein
MFKLLLISIVVVPVLLGVQVAGREKRRQGAIVLMAVVLAYDVFYMAMLYYLRIRWVGAG